MGDLKKIPLPCRFGDTVNCAGQRLPLCGVQWRKWGSKTEYTYFFHMPGEYRHVRFYSSTNEELPYFVEIPWSLLLDRPFKEHGYPLNGTGHAAGLEYRKGVLFMDFVDNDCLHSHIGVECDRKGAYVPNGDIIFNANWSAKQKEQALLRSML
jgi:hypothetical protein